MLQWRHLQMKIPHELKLFLKVLSIRSRSSTAKRLGVGVQAHVISKCRYLGAINFRREFVKMKNWSESFVLPYIYHKLTRQIQPYTAPDQSDPYLQILLWREGSSSDNVLHGLSSVARMYEIYWHIGDRVVLPHNMSCR